ncbi:MAG: cytochrome c biogenesis protein CcsA [Nitriliruptoraceae bacterium]
MTQIQLAEWSRVLYSPTTILLYFAAAFVYLYALTTTVGRVKDRVRGRRAQQAAGVVTVLGLTAHIAHEIFRGLAQDRLPLGNMFEVTSLMALVGVGAGVGYLQFVRKRPELNGFVLLAGGLLVAFAGLMYAEPGPLMPILDTWWRPFHVSLLVAAMGIFAAGFVFHGLYLLSERAEQVRLVMTESSAGAATTTATATVSGAIVAPQVRIPRDAARDATTAAGTPGEPDAPTIADPSVRSAMRQATSPFKLGIGMFLGTATVSWVFIVAGDTTAVGVGRFLGINIAMVAAALIAWWFTPFLPSAQTLDGLAHRTIAFAFVMWTVGTIAGAMWAEQSWGRFWGWDPKETGAFLTWVVYAGYLHGRATRGVRGRLAAWIGIGAFVVLMGTYLIANYVIVGLHSYAGL